jgi:hypothetical protein
MAVSMELRLLRTLQALQVCQAATNNHVQLWPLPGSTGDCSEESVGLGEL